MVAKKSVAPVAAAVFLAIFAGGGVFAESTDGFSFELGLGTETLLDDPTLPTTDPNYGSQTTYQKLQLKPDFSIGKIGIGLDLTVHFNLQLGTGGEGIDIYEPDWIPAAAGKSFLELYLPKIAYIRYGYKGDPLYAKLGSFDDGTLGNGFIMGNYANTRFLPETRIFGAALDLDGSLFSFPYVGMETFVGNLARFDVIGTRLYVRPLAGTELPLLDKLQVGATFARDGAPLLYDGDSANDDNGDSVNIVGGDFRLPVLGSDVVSMATFGDLVFQPESRWGSMVGVGGRLVGIFLYGAQLRVMGPGFIPTYFDSSYDLFRSAKYALISQEPTGDVFAGWYASLGTSLMDDKIVFNAALDGPFSAAAGSTDISDYPHLRGVFTVADGFLAGFSFDALYEKYYIGRDGSFFEDLISPENAVIGAQINYKTGPAVLSLIYNLRYDPADDSYIVSSSLLSSIQF